MADDAAWDKDVPGERERETLLGHSEQFSGGTQPSFLKRWWPACLVATATMLLGVAVLVHVLQPSDSTANHLELASNAIQMGEFELAADHLRSIRDDVAANTIDSEKSRYHLLAAGLIRAQESPTAPWVASNAEKVVDHLESARSYGGEFTSNDCETLALAYVYANQMASSTDALQALLDHPNPVSEDIHQAQVLNVRRARAGKAGIDSNLMAAERIPFLRELREDESATLDDLIWTSATIARIHLDAGNPSDAAVALHRDIRRLESRGGPASAELLVLLGRSNRDQGQFEAAIRPLRYSLDLARPEDPVRAEAMVMLGDVMARQGDLERARNWYEQAIVEFPSSRSLLAALAGRGRILDLLNQPDQAMIDFREAVRRIKRGDRHPDVNIASMEAVLLDRFESCLTRGETLQALERARLAGSLRTEGHRGSRVLTAIAVSAGQVAADRTRRMEAQSSEWNAAEWEDILELHAEAGHSYLAAAAVSEQHEIGWADAMFQAGVHLDAAGRQREAIGVLTDYVNAADSRDPRRIESMFRLAQALETDLSWVDASDWYARIIEDHPHSLHATRSHVPSARCLLAMGQTTDARCRLQSVVDGETTLMPGSEDYRNTLIMLGRLSVAESEYSEAINRLREAADRWPDHPDTPMVLFDIASARRSLAQQINDQLNQEQLTPNRRQQLTADRLENLWEAALTFDQVMEHLCEEEPPTPSMQRWLRAAAISRSDCLLETGRLKEAIAGYEAVARDWPDHAAAIHALVQVASAWTTLGEFDRADSAHNRALARLRDIPDEQLDHSEGFMNREVWERWMNTVPVGSELYAGAPTSE
tara:strand:+ start:327 stop:2801 length:2475 start_codon:yes stop_codon:yes gene_type:complete